MSRIDVLIYRDDDGSVPLWDWLDRLEDVPRARCIDRLELLEKRGADLRRPHGDYLGNGLYELRLRYGHVNLRMLYFFHGRAAAVVSHGFAKEREIPPREIRQALKRAAKFRQDPELHTFRPEPRP